MKMNAKPQIRTLFLKDIKPDAGNPRDITNEALVGLKMSLKRFGYVDLLVVNKRNMRIIAGHQRYKIFKQERIARIPCVVVDVDKVQAQAMSISLNNQQIAGFWTNALIPILDTLRKRYPEQYINLRLQELREDVRDLEIENMGAGKILPDDIPEPPKDIITEMGDLWLLGEHRLLCGDSRREKDVAYLMGKHKAKLFATDPPYMVDYTGANRPGGGGKNWSNFYHEVDIKNAEEFLRQFYGVGLKFTEKKAALYLWHASKHIGMITKTLRELKILIHQMIIWVKPCAVLTFAVYPWRHEPCLLSWQKGNKPNFRVSESKIGTVWKADFLKMGDPTRPEYYTDVWELDFDGKKRNTGQKHPTTKPTEVFAIPMRIHTRPGDICFEPFCGSGSQIIAAERLNRRCFAIEIEPYFVDIAVKRWEEFTGKKAKRVKGNRR